MRGAGLRTLAALAALAVAPAAARVETYNVHHGIEGEGRHVRQKVAVRVRVETDEESRLWSSVPVYLNTNVEFVRFEAWVTSPSGERTRVPDKSVDRVEALDSFELYSSSSAQVIQVRDLEIGSLLDLEYEVLLQPWFTASRTFVLPQQQAVDHVRIEASGSSTPVTTLVTGALADYELRATDGGFVFEAEDLEPVERPRWAPSESNWLPTVHFAWNEASWDAVGSWYRGLLTDLPPTADSVRQLSHRLVASHEQPAERLEALTAFVRGDVRYVAVEIGVGGYQPSPSMETLERRWGDCKDKSFLLIDLLREAGLQAWPAIIRLAPRGRIEPELPSPHHFNHLIVAVEAEGLQLGDEAPIADGLLFIDPTQQIGGATWLHAGVQDQLALVVDDESSRLVSTPIRAGTALRSARADLTVAEDGSARGTLDVTLRGDAAHALVPALAGEDDSTVGYLLRAVLGDFLPRADFARLEHRVSTAGVPEVSVSAEVSLRRLLRGRDERRSVRIGEVVLPRTDANRAVPLVLEPGLHHTSWTLRLPPTACPSALPDAEVRTQAGHFHATSEVEGQTLRLERTLALEQRWFEPEELEPLLELQEAEQQSKATRIRLACT